MKYRILSKVFGVTFTLSLGDSYKEGKLMIKKKFVICICRRLFLRRLASWKNDIADGCLITARSVCCENSC